MMPRKTIILRYNQKHLLRPTTRWFCGYMTADLPQSLHKNCCTYDLNPNHLEKPITINPRKLRSTVAHHMIAIGVPMNVISEVLRHKDKATAPRHYTQITDIEIVRHAMNSVRFNTQADSTGNKTMFRYSVIKVQTQKMSQIKSTSGWSISRILSSGMPLRDNPTCVVISLGAVLPHRSLQPTRGCAETSSLPLSEDNFTSAWPCSWRGLPGHLHYGRCRWSLTPPFHHHRPEGTAVCFCGPNPAGYPAPGVTRRRAPWSADFPRSQSYRTATTQPT